MRSAEFAAAGKKVENSAFARRTRVAIRRRCLRLCAACVTLMPVVVAWADNGVPTPAKVVIVIEENHSYSQIIGSPSAPYVNALAAGGALMTQSYGITHPSQPNYIAFFSGATQGVTSDSVYPHSQFTAPNLAAKLLASPRGLSFGGYSETMPSVGYDGASAGAAPATYQRKHNPWVNWQDATVPLPANKLPASVNMPYAGYFPADYATLPTLSFVIPNQLHDMHDGTVAQGDAWLQGNLAAYAAWCQLNGSLLIVTWDEDDFAAANRIATIFYGPMVARGQYSETVNHYRVLRTLEDMYGLPHTANTISAAPILDIWVPCTPTFDVEPSSVSTCPGGAVSFHVTAAGTGPFAYQWHLQAVGGGWTPLADGPVPDVGTVSGATTDTLTISATQASGVFRCTVANTCGSVDSHVAQLTVSTLAGDVNCDCSVDLSDLAVPLAHFGLAAGATRADGDLDGDGDVDLDDLAILLSGFGSSCP